MLGWKWGFAAALTCMALGCGDGAGNGDHAGDGDGDVHGDGDGDAQGDGDTAGDGNAKGDSDGDTQDPGDGDGDSDDGGTGPGDGDQEPAKEPREVCDAYIACVRAATPQTVTAAIATYGGEGTCWRLDGVKPEDCATECQAQFELLSDAYGNVSECGGSVAGSALADLSDEQWQLVCEGVAEQLNDSSVMHGLCLNALLSQAQGDGTTCQDVDETCATFRPSEPVTCQQQQAPACDDVTAGELQTCFADEVARYETLSTHSACDANEALLSTSASCMVVLDRCPEAYGL